jgi:radical SAM protein (TIGR01212 family)
MQPYYPISQVYKKRFGEKVYKIPVSVAQSCPNREGIRGMKTCNFCDEWGSAAYPEFRHQKLKKQIETTRQTLRQKVHANKFLVYYQAYTNTFQKVQRLREQFEVACEFDDVVGFVVGTRPDCLSDAVIELWREFAKHRYVAVEMGVQSFDEEALIWMRRGHTAQQSIQACLRLAQQCPEVDLGIHLMFGLPGESRDSVKVAAEICNRLPITNVKLHNLHVLAKTPLAEDYKRGLFTPIDFETYLDRVLTFLQHLRPTIAVHRLAALSRRHEELIAPAWTGRKMEIYQRMLNAFRERQVYQGQLWQSSPASAHPSATHFL